MFGLSFLYPLFLAGLAAVAIPIALHLFRRRTETVVDFPAVQFLQKAPVEQQRRRRLREWLLLALRVTALVLLALAFARPFFAGDAAMRLAPVTLVALDTSLSLSAPGQFEQARAAARQVVQDTPATHTVGLVTFADGATLVVPPTADRAAVLAAVDQVTPSAGGTRFRPALALAAEAMRTGQGTLAIVTDLQQTGWVASGESVMPDGIDVSVREVPPPAGNLAVVAARVDGDTIVAGVHNFGAGAARVPVSLLTGGTVRETTTIEVAPQAAGDVRFRLPAPAAGGAEIRIEDGNGYAHDNVRYLVLDPPDAVPVFVVTADPPEASRAGLYVERALSLAGEGRTFDVRVIDGRAFSAMAESEFARAGALVVMGTTTLDRTGRERIAGYLRAGGRALLTLGPRVDPATLADTIGAALEVEAEREPSSPSTRRQAGETIALVAVDGRHPIFRPFLSPSGGLGDVFVERFTRLAPDPARTVLARFSSAGDALVEQPIGQGRLLVFASDLDNEWNRFPLNPSFVPWVIETVRYLAQGREHSQSYVLPDVRGVPAVPGLHQVDQRLVAVNFDVREANPARTSLEEFQAGIVRAPVADASPIAPIAREQEERQRLWQLGLLVMFIALAGEGFIGRKAT